MKQVTSMFFDPEDEGDMFLRNVGGLSKDYTVLYPRRQLFITTAVRTPNPTLVVLRAKRYDLRRSTQL
jgi:hypothetical protein